MNPTEQQEAGDSGAGQRVWRCVLGGRRSATDGNQHEVHLKSDTAPQWSRPRRMAPDTWKEVRDEVEYLIQQGLIRESTSPWAAPIVAARRKNGRLRLAMDYQRLNADSHPQHHPLPLIDDLVDQLTEAQFFSTVDLKSGCYQMPMRREDAAKTVFVTPDGQYEWTGQGTPFGLSGAPATFHRLMSELNGCAMLPRRRAGMGTQLDGAQQPVAGGAQ